MSSETTVDSTMKKAKVEAATPSKSGGVVEQEGGWSLSRGKFTDEDLVQSLSLSRTRTNRSGMFNAMHSPRSSISQRSYRSRQDSETTCFTPAEMNDKMRRYSTTSTERNKSIATIHEDYDYDCNEKPDCVESIAISYEDEHSHQDPIATTRCLQEFEKVVARKVDRQKAAQKRLRKERHQRLISRHSNTLQQLQSWIQYQAAQDSISSRVKYFCCQGFKPKQPLADDVVQMTEYYYPQRRDFKAYICDFSEDSLTKQEIGLDKIDPFLEDLPPPGTVRWIHCPLGIGLLHSTIEDRFLLNKRKHATSFTGHAAFPYTHFETLAICARKSLQVMRDIQINIRVHKDFAAVRNVLDASALEGLSPDIRADLDFRTKHWRLQPDFWTLVCSDFPRQLACGESLEVDPRAARRFCTKVVPQAMSKNYYEDAHVVRQPFRLFHSSDGVVLTMGDCNGIDFLDANMNQYLTDPPQCIYDNEDASAIGLMFQLFASTGTKTWYKKNVEWFMIYLLTEIIATPHNYRQGCNAPNLARAYVDAVQDLKERRYLDFRPNESVKLVREYLACIDEISSISSILTHSLETLEELGAQTELLDWIDQNPNNPEEMSARERIIWATQTVKEAEQLYRNAIRDLRRDLDALFQLRSIEQNERSIITDSQNKAILLFTAVTVVFLPLSFFTSYYGMNLRGIIDTTKTEIYFWRVCGIIAIAIVLIVSMLAFRHRVRDAIKDRRAVAHDMTKYDIV